jgi:NTP pyrophosphatase (non-canonical NTP hydrolase)
MTYCIYHIPGKKIGVTNNLEERVTRQQGYTEDEYEILDMSDDICYISHREIELQKEYGYKVDRKLYKDLNPIKQELNSMNINVTEQTTTFPCPVSKLKGRLMDEIGMSWETEHGRCCIDAKSIDWIMNNVKTSMYNNDRCYVYNKAFARYFDNNGCCRATSYEDVDNNGFGRVTCFDDMVRNKTNTGALHMGGRRRPDRFDLIRTWADERGLYDKGDTKTQYLKLMEEAGELGRAILKNDEPEFIDAIGDMVVVLTNLARLGGVSIETCIDSAYDVISKRTGKMVNGTFVKDTL